MVKILGICGSMGSGKTTFADLLTDINPEQSLHLETSQVVVELGNLFSRNLDVNTIGNTKAGQLAAAEKPLEALRLRVSEMAGRLISSEDLAIEPDDVEQSPEWYDKLFVYMDTVSQYPELAETVITSENK